MDHDLREISITDFHWLVTRCHSLPPAKGNYLVDDYVENLLLTVLDFQMHGTAVSRAIEYYRLHRKQEIVDFNTLANLLQGFPDTKEGNLQAAQYLWGYKMWNRVELLRRFMDYFEERGITTQDQLKEWATQADFKRDFEGKIKGAGYAIFQWLVMRQGVETVKPDIWIHRFIQETLGYDVTDTAAVRLIERVAQELGIKAYELDWRIWEYTSGRS